MKLTQKIKIDLEDIGFIGSQEKLTMAERKKIDEITTSFVKALKKKSHRKHLLKKPV